MTDGDTTALEGLPPSAKLVYAVLEEDGPMTQKAIVDATELAPSTVHDALERLAALGVVEEQFYVADGRQDLYVVSRPPTLGSAVRGSDVTSRDD